MTKTQKSSGKTSSEEAIRMALASKPGATAAAVASAAGVGRSTATKVLARLSGEGQVSRVAGGREGARRLPDRFSLASTQPAPKDTKRATLSTAATPVPERLKPGQLDGLVLAFLKKNASDGPYGPTVVAKALERSSGAVGNCLNRLAQTEKVRQVGEHPRRYQIAA